MTTKQTDTKASTAPKPIAAAPALHVAPGPHFGTTGRSTRWMMLDVLIALAPAVAMSFHVFGARAGMVIGTCVASCLLTETIFQLIRRRPITIADGSAAVTGLILALSLPWTSPWWLAAIGGVVAVGIGKMVFGGLGHNVFNPAMVGRAFLMICFALQMGGRWQLDGRDPVLLTVGTRQAGGVAASAAPPGGEVPPAGQARRPGEKLAVDAASGATPLTSAKLEGIRPRLAPLIVGAVNGCLGETSAVLLLLGGLYLCLRRTAAWQIPAGVLLGAMAVATVHYLLRPDAPLTPLHHLAAGGLMLGAFFIATDPVSSPVSARGRWVFGLGVGAMTLLIRLLAGYPEGMMFAVLILNSVTPLINRLTIPVPVGGKPKPPTKP